MADETAIWTPDSATIEEGYEPAPGLLPIDETLRRLVPFNVGERVAFGEEHPEHPGRYGVVKAIGFADGGIRLDLLVFDPHTGDPNRSHTLEENGDVAADLDEHDAVIYRAGMEEIQ